MRVPRRAASAALAAGGVAFVLAGSHGFAARQGTAPWLPSSPVVAWAAAQPGWQDGDFPIAFAPQPLAPLAGDRLQHHIALVPAAEPCARTQERAARGWVVVGTFPFADRRQAFAAGGCLRGAPVRYRDPLFTVYGTR